MLSGVTITKGKGGLGKQDATADMIMGLLMHGIAVSGWALNVPKKLYSVDDAEQLGIDANYDTTNNVLCHYHISEFFRMNPNGQLWVMMVAQSTIVANMLDITLTNVPAKQLLVAANGEINVLGVAMNKGTSYTPTLLTGLDTQIVAAIPKAEALADDEWTAHRPVHIVLEGASFNGTVAAALNLRAQAAPSVSVVIAQDNDVANISTAYAGYAAVGTMLGVLSAAKVSENIGWVEKFPLTDVANGDWVNPGFSNKQLLGYFSLADYTTLHGKGYIMPRLYAGNPNAYFNDDHTCTLITDDYAQIIENRTINKAAKLVYAALLPQTNGAVPVDSTGKMTPEFVSGLESRGEAPLDDMKRNDDLSDKKIYIDPAQNVVSNSTIACKIRVIPMGCSRVINVDLALAASF